MCSHVNVLTSDLSFQSGDICFFLQQAGEAIAQRSRGIFGLSSAPKRFMLNSARLVIHDLEALHCSLNSLFT